MGSRGPRRQVFVAGVGSRAELDLEPFMHFPPVTVEQLLFKLARQTLGRAQNIATPALLQKLQIIG